MILFPKLKKQIVLYLRDHFISAPYPLESKHLLKDSIVLLEKTPIRHWADMKSIQSKTVPCSYLQQIIFSGHLNRQFPIINLQL